MTEGVNGMVAGRMTANLRKTGIGNVLFGAIAHSRAPSSAVSTIV
jgi:hypothetical protein